MPVRIHHVLCPIDFSEGSRHALDYAVMLARWYHARLSVVHVHQLSMPVYGVSYLGPEGLQPIVLTELERRQLLDRLEKEVAEDRTAAHLDIETALDEEANVAEAIVSRARTTPADVIVIGTHGRSGFERLILGSVAEKVLRKAACPVLTVPAHSPDAVPLDAGSMRRILCPVDFSTSFTGGTPVRRRVCRGGARQSDSAPRPRTSSRPVRVRRRHGSDAVRRAALPARAIPTLAHGQGRSASDVQGRRTGARG